MLTQQINPKFFSGLGESEKAIQGNDKSEDPGSLVMMDQVQELLLHLDQDPCLPQSLERRRILSGDHNCTIFHVDGAKPYSIFSP